ncbi:hypothetical protein BJY00DRAFT_220608 [Aspergillus carlsbadensis]|nr:hypothetical protein BJY00DRAFT_220608 [Aspergillus carlsbadensis]
MAPVVGPATRKEPEEHRKLYRKNELGLAIDSSKNQLLGTTFKLSARMNGLYRKQMWSDNLLFLRVDMENEDEYGASDLWRLVALRIYWISMSTKSLLIDLFNYGLLFGSKTPTRSLPILLKRSLTCQTWRYRLKPLRLPSRNPVPCPKRPPNKLQIQQASLINFLLLRHKLINIPIRP